MLTLGALFNPYLAENLLHTDEFMILFDDDIDDKKFYLLWIAVIVSCPR